ncbi:MAG: HAMP domain-containing sensor histidine kinase [Chthoniobacteraceae bacterium]
MKHFSEAYGVSFTLFDNNGTQRAGNPVVLPPEVVTRLQQEFRGHGFGGPGDMGGGAENANPAQVRNGVGVSGAAGNSGDRPDDGPGGPRHRLMIHTSNPSRYWVVLHFPPFFMRDGGPGAGPSPGGMPMLAPLTLVVESSSINGGGLFFEITPWLYAGLGVLVLSLVLWIPLVRGITRSIGKMNTATRQIAEGAFDTRIASCRNDELGTLSHSINHMAERLEGFVAGQKRFLGDIAHELCTPIARMQMAMGILEQRIDESEAESIEDLREELQEMSLLVNELLSFSKASLGARTLQHKPIELRAFLDRVIEREASGNPIVNSVHETLQVMVEPDLFQRAVANLLRNALRYAGSAGPIGFSASREHEYVWLTVWDCGPGIPEDALARVFDPFYRVDPSRDRETGGVGLGLAIVKTCIEGCGGTITCRNRPGGGAEFVLRLLSAGK